MKETMENRPHLAEKHDGGHTQELFKDAYNNAAPDVPSPPPESWTQTLINFGTAAQLYGGSQNETHPFTAAEIALAGTISSVELNATFQNNNMSVLANEAPNCVPSSALEASLSKSDMRLNGLYTGVDGQGNFGSGAQIREAVLENSTQSGSAGIDQYTLNDCSFESAVASMASTEAGQKAIAQMITQNKDGSYNVQFPGAKKPITITEKDLANPELGNSAEWANILEAASFKIDPATAQKGAHGKVIEQYLNLLTGHEADGENLTGRKENDVEAALRKLLAHGAVVEGGDAPSGAPLEQGHAYSILSLNGDTLTIRNPWGNNFPNQGAEPAIGETKKGVTNIGGGELTMSFETYMADLPVLFYSEQK